MTEKHRIATVRSPLFRRLRFGVLACCLLLSLMRSLSAQEPAPGGVAPIDATSSPAFVTTESAEYRGRIAGTQITGGKFTFQIVRRGTGPAWIDWSSVRIAMNHLAWEKQALIAGTAPDQRTLLMTQRDSDVLSGDWSLTGETIGTSVVFDLTLPPALNNRVLLDIPTTHRLESRQGLVQAHDIDDEAGTQLWTIELGSASIASLLVSPVDQPRAAAIPRYEIDTEYRVRRDGVFLRTDLTIDGTLPGGVPISLEVPATLEVQSITLVGAGPQGGIPLPFFRAPDQPRLILIPADSLVIEGNIPLRIRAFDPVVWKGRRPMPRIRWREALESKRSLTLRVEPPLQIQGIDPGDLLQTGLISDETAGEVWRFEARDPNTELNVQIGLPDSPLTGEILCLSDARPEGGWTAAVSTLRVENGSRFETHLQLPEDWKLISVSSNDTESRIASWEVVDQILTVTWQNALTRISPRQLHLFARTPPRLERAPFRLSVPQVRGAHDVQVQYQLLLPVGTELQLLEGENWRTGDGNEISPVLMALREVTERLPEPSVRNVATLRSSADNRAVRLLVAIAARDSTEGRTVPLTDSTRSKSDAEGPHSEQDFTPPIASLELQTIAGQSNPRECVQHALLTFSRPVTLADLQLQLPADCRLSVIKLDDRPITVFRTQDGIPIPAEFSSAERIQLTYITPATSQILGQRFPVPLPRCRYPLTSFRWSVDLPGEQQLSQVLLPGEFSLESPVAENDPSLFGPLSRGKTEQTFSPFSPASWRSLLGSDETGSLQVEQTRRLWHFVAPQVGTEVEFVTWNVSRSRSYAWVALLGSLLLGLTGRRFRMTWVRTVTIFWILLLVLLVGQASPAWTPVVGGLLAGSLLALIFPRSWLQRNDLLSPVKVILHPVATTTAILLAVFWMTSGRTLTADVTAGGATSEPVSLIRSALYELQKVQPVCQIKGTFEVLVRRDVGGVLLKLPFQDVVFPADAHCLIDGTPSPLIPAASGDAMLVRLDETSHAAGTPIAGTDWIRHSVQLTFSLRPADAEFENRRSFARGMIPRILDSQLTIPEEFLPISWERFGEMTRHADLGETIQLGLVGHLKTITSPTSAAPVLPIQSMQTLLDVSTLRVRGMTRIQPTQAGWPSLLPLDFPAGTLLSSITGSNVIDWVETTGTETNLQFTVRMRSDAAPQPIVISYEFPSVPGMGATLTIPAIPLIAGTTVPHSIGLTGPPLTTLSLTNRAGMTLLTSEEWQALPELGRQRPALSIQTKSPMPISLDFVRMRSSRSAAVTETLLVRRETLNYSAVVRMNVTEAPTFRHQFRLDPAVHLEAVTTGVMGNDGPVRFTRDGALITLYLAGGQLGERVFHLKGSYPALIDLWSPVPSLQPVETQVSDSVLTIEEETGWNVDLEGEQGVLIPLREEKSSQPGFRVIGLFRGNDRPRRIRVTVPPRAIQAESVTVIQTPANDDWEQISTIHFASVEAPLRKIAIRIPGDLVALRVRPSLFPYSIQPYGKDTLLTVRVPERYSSSATLTVSSRFSPDFMERVQAENGLTNPVSIPQIQVLSAIMTSQYVLTESESRLQLGGAVRVPAGILPGWIPAEWSRDVQNETFTCFHQSQPALTLQRPTRSETGRQPVIALEETLLWPVGSRRTQGMTRWWLMPKGISDFTWSPPAGVKVESISSDSGVLVTTLPESEDRTISLPAGQELVPILIHWSSQGTSGKFPLLQAPFGQPEHRALSIVTPRMWKVTSGNAVTLETADLWLARTEALLQCWHETGPVSASAGLLSRNLEICRSRLNELERSGTLDDTQREAVHKMLTQWQESNAATPGHLPGSVPLVNITDDLFTDVLTQSADSVQTHWFRPPDGETWTGQVQMRRSGIQWLVLTRSLLLLVCAGWLLYRFPAQIVAIREWASRHPFAVLAGIGLLWWCYLSPSAVGLLLILISITSLARQNWMQRKMAEDVTYVP